MDNRFEQVIQEIDRINSEDPTLDKIEGKDIPVAQLYGQRMTLMLVRFDPDANELLRLAARGQHIRRWSVPRKSYPMDRKGYLKWRTELKLLHATLVKDIMIKHGYSEEEAQVTGDLILKKRLKQDQDAQTLEDVVCLVFLRYYFDDFIEEHKEEEEKIASILQKTWHKMSKKGHEAALRLGLSENALRLVQKALEVSE